MNDLEIPERAHELMEDMGAVQREQAASIIVAAELRRIATPGRNGIVTYNHLRRRADELDSEES